MFPVFIKTGSWFIRKFLLMVDVKHSLSERPWLKRHEQILIDLQNIFSFFLNIFIHLCSPLILIKLTQSESGHREILVIANWGWDFKLNICWRCYCRLTVGTQKILCAMIFLYVGSRGKQPCWNITCKSISRERQVRKFLCHRFALNITCKVCQNYALV